MDLDGPNVHKKTKQHSSKGENILQKLNPTEIANQFVTNFYTALISNPNQLISSGILKEHTELKLDQQSYKGQNLLNILTQIRTTISQYKQCKQITFIEKGSRTMNILVQFPKDKSEKMYIQEFTIVFNKIWWVQSSIFMII